MFRPLHSETVSSHEIPLLPHTHTHTCGESTEFERFICNGETRHVRSVCLVYTHTHPCVCVCVCVAFGLASCQRTRTHTHTLGDDRSDKARPSQRLPSRAEPIDL